jgi:hypothetical protein
MFNFYLFFLWCTRMLSVRACVLICCVGIDWIMHGAFTVYSFAIVLFYMWIRNQYGYLRRIHFHPYFIHFQIQSNPGASFPWVQHRWVAEFSALIYGFSFNFSILFSHYHFAIKLPHFLLPSYFPLPFLPLAEPSFQVAARCAIKHPFIVVRRWRYKRTFRPASPFAGFITL